MVAHNGYTSLHIACHFGHLDVVITLIDAKVNLFIKHKDGYNPFDLADIDEIRQYIINKKPWYHRRQLVMMRPHNDHISNKKHHMTALGWLVKKLKKQVVKMWNFLFEESDIIILIKQTLSGITAKKRK